VLLALLATGISSMIYDHHRAEYSATLEAVRVAEALTGAQLRAQLAEARLETLRMQLDPHFLFNTLHAISSLVERDPRGVRRMISRLSELLRHTIEGPTEQEIPLREELGLLRRYLEIMEVRFQGRLAVSSDVDDRVLDALVPNLILQPIVENAIKHGVSQVEGIGRIVIRGSLSGDQVVLSVENNGPTADDMPRVEGKGLGIRNTRARLEHLYGAQQSFTLRPAGDGGTIAEIRLPHHTRSDLRPAVVSFA
jgi:LytS/YehU family sensor histidine kinase